MIKFTHVADSKTPPVYTYFRHAGLFITRSIFQPGQWQTLRYPQDVKYSELSSRHIQLRGTYVDASGRVPTRSGGWISETDDTLIPAGDYQRVAQDIVEVWCVRSRFPEGDASHVESLKIEEDGIIEVDVGEHILLIEGVLATDSRELRAVQYAEVKAAPKTLHALADSYLFRWREVAPPAPGPMLAPAEAPAPTPPPVRPPAPAPDPNDTPSGPG